MFRELKLSLWQPKNVEYMVFTEFKIWNVANTLQTHGFSLLLTTPHDFILAAFTISPTPAKVTVG